MVFSRFGNPCRRLEAASPPGCPAGGVCAASGPRRFEGSGSCLPFHCPTAQRQRTRRAAPPPTDPGDRRSGGARDASKGRRPRSRRRRRPQSKRRGKARATPATTRAQGARGPRANPLPPALKYRIRRPPGRDGGRGEAHSAARGEGGEPPRGRAHDTADATEATSTAEQGAGRSARRHQERERRSSTVLTPGRKTTQRARVGRASRRNDSGAGRRPTGPTATAPSAPRSAGSGNGLRLAAGAGTGHAQTDRPRSQERPRRASVQAARRTATRRAAKCHPAQRVAVHNWPGAGGTAAQRAGGPRARIVTARTERGGAGGRIASSGLLTASESVSDGWGGMIPFPVPSERL